METVKKRKRRSDRSHLIYLLTNTCTGERYVGLTVMMEGSVKKTMHWRWHRHVHRAMNHGKSWKLCESIRTHGAEAFKVEVLDKVRGKAMAHALETELKKIMKTELNTA